MPRPTQLDFSDFAQIRAAFPRFHAWLVAERDEAMKTMTTSRDQIQIHRLQGDVHRLNTLIEHLEKASAYLQSSRK